MEFTRRWRIVLFSRKLVAMSVIDLIAASDLPSSFHRALIRAVSRLSDVQLDQLGVILPSSAARLTHFFASVHDDDTLTSQAKVEYAIHEVAKELRTIAEGEAVKKEAAELDRLMREM